MVCVDDWLFVLINLIIVLFQFLLNRVFINRNLVANGEIVGYVPGDGEIELPIIEVVNPKTNIALKKTMRFSGIVPRKSSMRKVLLYSRFKRVLFVQLETTYLGTIFSFILLVLVFIFIVQNQSDVFLNPIVFSLLNTALLVFGLRKLLYKYDSK